MDKSKLSVPFKWCGSVVLNISYVGGKYTAFYFLSSYLNSYSLSILPLIPHLLVCKMRIVQNPSSEK
jgi:hypothetical protein